MTATEKKLIEKLEELVETANKEVQLATGDLCIKDSEGFTYNVLAISQKITKLESEIAFLKQQIAEDEITEEDIWKWWKTQNFQKEQGEQEYTMIYGIDLPKILKAFKNGEIKHINLS